MKVATLQAAYDKAVRTNKKQFTCEGNEFVTAYAKYVLEYAQSRDAIDITLTTPGERQRKRA